MKHKRFWIGAAGIAIAGVAVAIGIMVRPSIAPIDPPAPASFDPQLVRAGARVVALGDCVVCHTAKDGKPFAGGLPLATPFGTIYATNITPDPETGIGEPDQLMAPRPPELGETVGQHHQGALAAFRDVQPDAVGRDVPVPPGTGDPYRRRVRRRLHLRSAAAVSFTLLMVRSGARIFFTRR